MEKVVNKLSFAVCEIYVDILDATKKRIKEKIHKKERIASDQVVLECMYQMIGGNVWRLMNKTFVYEFHKFRVDEGFPFDKNSSNAYEKYVTSFDFQEVKNWFKKYPVLENMVRNSVANTCAYMERVLKDFYDDSIEFEEKFKISADAILTKLSSLDSDPHNKGTMVLIAEFSDGHRVIYKPRSFAVDILFKDIFEKVIVFPETDRFIPVPECINRKDHGWTLFVENNSISEDKIGEAFYRLGLYTPIFSCFASTDMHDENIIFDGVNPYFIDLETAIQPVNMCNGENLFSEMQRALTCSISNTSIIPAKLMGKTLNYLLGAINTPYPQETEEKVFRFVNLGTDAIDIARENVSIDRIANPIKNESGEVIDPVPYLKDFIRGYRKGYRELLKNKDKIIKMLEQFDEYVRIVLRPTTQYYMILDACLYPENMTSEAAVSKILGYMKSVTVVENETEAKKVLKEEWDAMLMGDIPYFYIKGNEHAVTINNYKTCDVYEFSPVENVIESLNRMSEDTLLFDERLIAEGYSEIKTKNSKKNGINYPSQSPIFEELLEDIMEDRTDRIYDFYNRLSVKVKEGDKTEAAWIGGVYGDLPVSYNSISLVSLHDTGGIPVTLRNLSNYAAICKDKLKVNLEEYNALYQAAVNGLKTEKKIIFDSGVYASVSVISGESSLDMVLNNIEEEDKVEAIYKCLKNNIDSPLGDIYNGRAGIYLLLASCEDTDVSLMKQAKKELEEIAERGYEKFGIAHGELGILWARFRVCRFLKEKDSCLKIFERVKEIYKTDYDLGNGWCNGYSGVLTILAEMMTMPEIKSQGLVILKDLARKVTTVKADTMYDLSICHGVAGVLQSLVYCYFLYLDKYFLDVAEEYWTNVCKVVKINSFYTGEPNKDYLLGYFLGWSGLIDAVTMLRLCRVRKELADTLYFPFNLSCYGYQNKLRNGGIS